LYKSMANAHVLAKQPTVPLEELHWTELCALLHENVEALIANFQKAKERIGLLEYICKHRTDTVNNLQQNQEDAFGKMSEQFKTQEYLWQKEKQYMKQQHSHLLAGIHTRAQVWGCELLIFFFKHLMDYFNSLGLLAKWLKSVKLSLLVRRVICNPKCSLLFHNHHLLSLSSHSFTPVSIKSIVNKGKRYPMLFVSYCNLLHRIMLYFMQISGLEVAVCHILVIYLSCKLQFFFTGFEEEGVDCVEALNWITSANLHAAIMNSISELEGALNNQDPHSWLSGNSLISAARNCFAKLMDNLSVLMQTVQGNSCMCRAFVEKDSLIQRLANGLHRINSQAMDAGF
ncbi:CC171 protein, partial [Prunella fulvescens]|nr:CC171 protein [Prunella fulvescens]